MALAKERIPQDSHMGLIQACSFYENVYGGTSVQVSDSSSIRCFGYNAMIETEEGLEKTYGSAKNFSFPDPGSVNGSGFVFGTKNSPATEGQSVINFNSGYDNRAYSGGSLLSFDQGDCSILADSMDHNYHWNQLNIECGTDSRPSEVLNCLETASNYGSMNNTVKDDYLVEDQFGWFYSETVTDGVHQSEGQEASFHKRPHMGGEMQAPKKLCTGAPRKPKPKSVPSKDPQSIAAKNRRERISERLKILQELVPNGAKVDLVTMLEKAISYVKFLQLQVKVLATDEFWPMQGGKAPEVAQVKEAIDAILSSHIDRNSSSK